MTVVVFSPKIGPVSINTLLSEEHSSRVEITGNPIETGAEVNDHAYIKPKEVALDIADANAAATFEDLVRFQESRIPFSLVTGLKMYNNMLIQEVNATRDERFSRVLRATVYLREVIIVSTAVTTGTGSSGANRQVNGGKKAAPGGANSRTAATPTKELATNSATANRTAGTVTRGDTPSRAVEPAKSQSLAKTVFG